MIRVQSFGKPSNEALYVSVDIVAYAIFHLTASIDAARCVECVDMKGTMPDDRTT